VRCPSAPGLARRVAGPSACARGGRVRCPWLTGLAHRDAGPSACARTRTRGLTVGDASDSTVRRVWTGTCGLFCGAPSPVSQGQRTRPYVGWARLRRTRGGRGEREGRTGSEGDLTVVGVFDAHEWYGGSGRGERVARATLRLWASSRHTRVPGEGRGRGSGAYFAFLACFFCARSCIFLMISCTLGGALPARSLLSSRPAGA